MIMDADKTQKIVITANMNIHTNFSRRLDALLELYKKVICSTTSKIFSFSDWGMAVGMEENMRKLEDMQLLSMYLIMLEWKAYEQNTFYLEMDEEGCPIIQYPSTVVLQPEDEKNLVDCMCRYFQCVHHMDIESLFQVMGALPVGETPDGISFMVIDEGNTDCDNNIFEIDKQ